MNTTNVEAEESILAAILIDNAYLSPVLKILSPADLSSQRNRTILSAMMGLSREGKSIDLVTLAEKLRAGGELETIGGNHFLADLIDKVPMSADVGDHSRIVRDLSMRRALIAMTGEIQSRARIETDVDALLDDAGSMLFQLGKERTSAAVSFVSLESIHAMEIEEKPIAEGFLYEGEPLLIHAKGGVGKSLLTQDIALKLASVNDFFHRGDRSLWRKFHIPKQRRTIFLQSENSMGSIHRRIKKMVSGTPEYQTGLKNVFFPKMRDDILFIGDGFESSKFKFSVKAVVRAIEEQAGKIGVMVIDPLISFVRCNENDNHDMRRALDALTDLCYELRVTPILVHHDNRAGEYRGASAIFDWARNIIGLKESWGEVEVAADMDDETGIVTETRTQKVRQISVKHEKSNNFEQFAEFILRPTRNLKFVEVGDDKGLPEKVVKRCLEVVQALRDIGGSAKQAEIIAQYTSFASVSRATAQTHINSAIEHKYLVKTQDDSDLRNYRITLPEN